MAPVPASTCSGSYLPDLKDGGHPRLQQLRPAPPVRPAHAPDPVRGPRRSASSRAATSPTIYSAERVSTASAPIRTETIYGNNVFWVNVEFRFPLVDVIALPFLQFGGIRGRAYFDVGGAWLKGQPFQFWNSQNGLPRTASPTTASASTIYFLRRPVQLRLRPAVEPASHNIGPRRVRSSRSGSRPSERPGDAAHGAGPDGRPGDTARRPLHNPARVRIRVLGAHGGSTPRHRQTSFLLDDASGPRRGGAHRGAHPRGAGAGSRSVLAHARPSRPHRLPPLPRRERLRADDRAPSRSPRRPRSRFRSGATSSTTRSGPTSAAPGPATCRRSPSGR